MGWDGMIHTTFQTHEKTSRLKTNLQTPNLLLGAKAQYTFIHMT